MKQLKDDYGIVFTRRERERERERRERERERERGKHTKEKT